MGTACFYNECERESCLTITQVEIDKRGTKIIILTFDASNIFVKKLKETCLEPDTGP